VLAASGLAVTFGTLGGCSIDCDETYCDFIRAGATGVYAYELACCRDPDEFGCADRESRMLQFSVAAMEMRQECERENWARLGEIWNDLKGLLPIGVLLLVADDFCDGWGWAAHNLTTPFSADDTLVMAVELDPAPPRLQPVRSSGDGPPSATIATIEVDRFWQIRPGSMVSLDVFGASVPFAVEGSFAVVETIASMAGRHDQQVEEWCRRMKPRRFDLDLRSFEGGLTIALDRDFPGNHVRFESENRGVIGMAVTIDAILEMPPWPPVESVGDHVFLEIPFVLRPDGGLQFAPDGAMSMLEVWPVDPSVGAFVRGDDPSEFAGEDDDLICIQRAKAVAEGFLSLHPPCNGGGGDRGG
jgi:hypothetical protein